MKKIIIFILIMLSINNLKAQNSDFVEIIKYAVKAPSGHNTQPWKFKINENSVHILPNFTDTLPAVDGDKREFYISIGCAVENFCIAAQHFGYDYQIVSQNQDGILINLKKTETKTDNSLFYQIEKRQTNRSVYQSKIIPKETINMLQNIDLYGNTKKYIVKIDSPLGDSLTHYIMQGNEIQMNDVAFKNEVKLWLRFNNAEIKRMNNGLTYKTMGYPASPRFLGLMITNAK